MSKIICCDRCNCEIEENKAEDLIDVGNNSFQYLGDLCSDCWETIRSELNKAMKKNKSAKKGV